MAHVPSVLLIVENCPVPTDQRVWSEALALREQGFTVSVISPKGDKKHHESYCLLEGIHIYRYALPTGSSVTSYLIEYATALVMSIWLCLIVWRRHGLDVVHVANPPDIFFPIGWLMRACGKQFVYDQHDLAPELFEVLFLVDRQPGALARFFHRMMLLCEWLTYRTANLVIVTNQTFQRVALTRGGRREQNVVIVRNGPKLRAMRPCATDPALKMGKRYLLVYLGVMGAQDGVDYAIRALDYLVHLRGRDDVALALLGNGAQEQALRILTRDLGLDECVHFTGWVEREVIAQYLTTADIGISPDPRNMLNDACTMIKTMEYMAYSKPVIAFDLTETRFSAQGAALYAQPNVIEEFADKIETLLDDEELRVQMGALGRMRIEEVLSWEHSEQRLLSAYQELVRLESDG